MGLHSSLINTVKKLDFAKRAFVDQIPYDKADVVVTDISGDSRVDFYEKATYQEVQDSVQRRLTANLTNANTWLACGDSYGYIPQSKRIEEDIRAKQKMRAERKKVLEGKRDAAPTPYSKPDFAKRCFTVRDGALPNMERLYITPGKKEWISKVYADMIVKAFDVPENIRPIKTVIIDGVLVTVDPLVEPDGRPPATYIKRNTDKSLVLNPVERMPIGESDLRWIRWINRICRSEDYEFGLEKDDNRKRPVIVLDMNDSDILIIALMHMICFTDAETGRPLCELYMHYGKKARWYDYLNRTSRMTDEEPPKSTMININRLFCAIHKEFGSEGLGVTNPIEVFCALVLLAGDDFVKSIDDYGNISSAAPFKDFGPSNIFRLFRTNKFAREEFSMPISLMHEWEEMLGNPMVKKGLQFNNEFSMLGIVKRFYQGRLKGITIKDPYGKTGERKIEPGNNEFLESFQILKLAEQKRLDRLNKKDRDEANSKGARHDFKERLMTGFPSEHQAIAVIRRIFWRLDYIWNGGTGNYDHGCDVRLDERGFSLYGWRPDVTGKKVRLASVVACGLY